MLVPRMTIKEIRKEMIKDYPMVLRKMEYVAYDLKKTLDKKTFREGHIHFFDYSSKLKNHWICRVGVDPQEFSRKAMMVYHNGIGHVGISVIDCSRIIYHTGHFFNRYSERRNLNIKDFNSIVRSFLDENCNYRFMNVDCIGDRVYTIFGEIDSGIIAGTIDCNQQFLKMNTFLPEAILSPNQEKRLAKVRETMHKYKDTSGEIT
jgi:hypothetical protein